jgi:hypothetical protein
MSDNKIKRPRSVKTNENIVVGQIRYNHRDKYFYVILDGSNRSTYATVFNLNKGATTQLIIATVINNSWLVQGI